MTNQSDNVIRFPGTAVADTETAAAHWLARMTSGDVRLSDIAEFGLWRATSPDNDRVYNEIEAVWDQLGADTTPRSLYQRLKESLHLPPIVPLWSRRFGQIAAAVVMLIATGQYLTNWRYDYSTAPGEMRRIALADGSVVKMKGGTAINVHMSKTGARVIDLARGEAFFDVVHDVTRPFSVNVGSGTITDIGTSFSVRRDGHLATVAVEHGAVSVAASGRSNTLIAGEQVTFSAYELGRKIGVKADLISPWRRSLYIAEGRSLGEVLKEIDEYHPGRIVIVSRTLAARRVNAVVQFGHTNAWLEALSKTRGVSVRHWGPITIVNDRRI